ncbi:hypothetical protein [Polymorphospora sp. NPDC050346]|uniref:hypothetical protein n=1 Tax=Polymorphospora sp. NPDC050346 TaxID=3155780 RepID=UPI0033DD6F38
MTVTTTAPLAEAPYPLALREVRSLVDLTADLLVQADSIESWADDRRELIIGAHQRGLTVAEYEDAIERAIAYYESGQYAQDLWEEQGDLYGLPHADQIEPGTSIYHPLWCEGDPDVLDIVAVSPPDSDGMVVLHATDCDVRVAGDWPVEPVATSHNT